MFYFMLLNLVLWCLYLDIKIALRFNGWAYVIFYNECFCFRPLPAELMKYAREDTHYLTYIYHRMKQELLARGNDQKNLLLSVLQRSTEICAKVSVWSAFWVNKFKWSTWFFLSWHNFKMKIETKYVEYIPVLIFLFLILQHRA